LDVLVVIGLTWLFLLLLGLAMLRASARAERAAEQRLREQRTARPASERRHRVTTTAVVLATLPFAGAGAAAPDAAAQSCRGARSAPRSSAPAVTLCLINAERRAHGLSPLSANVRLARAAQRHAADMVARAYFSHVSPSGKSFTDRLRRAGYARHCAWAGGETLAWGSGTLQSPASRVAAWLRSPPHRAILLSPSYREAGIGIMAGSPGNAQSGATYVGEFGRRRC